jgi:hypothetical protein
MPTHWHFVVWPADDGELTAFLRRLTLTHSVRWHKHYGSTGSGHVYRNRFKAFPVAEDGHSTTSSATRCGPDSCPVRRTGPGPTCLAVCPATTSPHAGYARGLASSQPSRPAPRGTGLSVRASRQWEPRRGPIVKSKNAARGNCGKTPGIGPAKALAPGLPLPRGASSSASWEKS